MRIFLRVSLLVASVATAACNLSENGSPTGPSGPLSAGSPVIYSIVGASDGIGFGSSRPCFLYEDCDGNGYAWVAARQLRSQGFQVELHPLSIPGAVLTPGLQALGAQYAITIPSNLVQGVAPFVRKDATVVTVFAGANDVNTITGLLDRGAGGGDPAGFIDQQVAAFGTEFSAMIGAIRARAPKARIIVINLPNMAGTPYRANASLLAKQATQRASVGITTRAINPTPNVTVIDLMCDPRFYQASTFSADGFHPNDTGYAYIAGEIVAAITTTYRAPQSSCAAMVLY